jgi:hypothetical protein
MDDDQNLLFSNPLAASPISFFLESDYLLITIINNGTDHFKPLLANL